MPDIEVGMDRTVKYRKSLILRHFPGMEVRRSQLKNDVRISASDNYNSARGNKAELMDGKDESGRECLCFSV